MSDPAAGPPQFPPPIDPDDPGRGPLVMGLNYSFTVLAMMAVALRFYVRRKVGNRTWGWDDWLMLVAVVFQVICECLFALSFKNGFGKHDHSVQKPDQFVEIMKWGWIAQGFGQVTSILARLSITISLIGLFAIHRWFKWFLIVLTTIQTTLGTAMLVLSYAQVRPLEALWNVFMDPTKVWRLDTKYFINLGYLTQSVYTFSDVAYVAIPVAIIWRLNMPLHRRLGLITLLAAMLFTAAMSILKTYTIHWQGDPTVTDPLYRNALQVLYANLEQTSVIIMGCVPSLRAIVNVDLPFGLSRLGQSVASLLGSRRSGTTKGSGLSFPRGSGSGGGGIGSKLKSFGSSTVASRHEPDAIYTGGGGVYRDLELGTHTLGSHDKFSTKAPVVMSVTVGSPGSRTPAGNGGNQGGSTDHLVPPGGGNYVLRTDQFSVQESYQAPGKAQ
ncbi:hypothetical protein QBC41DRAFT_326642 [Cercophora samala]|uniref:Rhodopsin domain-containing protein n=1 Tax=Cercophora samala TaxID=330535 RepID=A0AA39Z9H2_9PEZI|nr:hypothetical protein QBC41DRAFT_326642 [Cercophora samala]